MENLIRVCFLKDVDTSLISLICIIRMEYTSLRRIQSQLLTEKILYESGHSNPINPLHYGKSWDAGPNPGCCKCWKDIRND